MFQANSKKARVENLTSEEIKSRQNENEKDKAAHFAKLKSAISRGGTHISHGSPNFRACKVNRKASWENLIRLSQ